MSKPIGEALPADALSLLDGTNPRENLGKMIALATIDDDGFPHTSLLSAGEVLAIDTRRIRLALDEAGHTLANIVGRGKVVLVLVDADLCYYVRAIGSLRDEVVPPGPTQPFRSRVVELVVQQVLQDAEAGASVTSGARYERNIPAEEELGEWERVWSILRSP